MSGDPDRWRRVEKLCSEALDRSGADRDAFLSAACGSDDGLRREVEGLLAHERSAECFLELPAPVAAAGAAHTASELIGRRLGPYEILEPVGAGGMGVVYRAHDANLRRDVAIKVLPASLRGNHQPLVRFEREARVLAALSHPSIGAIYGVEDLDGVPALVLEWVGGETLQAKIHGSRQRGRRHVAPGQPGLAVGEALAIARQIAEALEAAHEKSIVHRDLKPANIKIAPDGTVKVLDFGLAKVAAENGDGEDAAGDNGAGGGRSAAGNETAAGMLNDFQPDVVIGVGGYASGPAMLAAILKHMPTLAFEPNLVPGFANRMVARFRTGTAVGENERFSTGLTAESSHFHTSTGLA